MNGIGKSKDIELAIFVSLCSGILEKPLLPQMVVLGEYEYRWNDYRYKELA